MWKFLLLFSFLINFCLAQSYEESIDKCNKAFQEGMSGVDINSLEQQMLAKDREFRKCILSLKFPTFEATSLDGKTYTSNLLKGKVVLINFWFIGCPPCVAEMPLLSQLNAEFENKDFLILSFSLDDTKSIEEFQKKHPMGYAIFANSKDLIANKFKLQRGYPTSIFLNKKGEIVEFITGGQMTETGLKKTKEEFKSIIEKELAK